MIEDKIIYNDYWERVQEKDKEIERLNNIINELEKWLKSEQERYRQYLSKRPTNDSEHTSHYATRCGLTQIEVVLEELQELKGSDKE